MERDLSIVQTKDGSQTIRNNQTGDTYHSVHGAVQESQHVFIKSGLEYFFQNFIQTSIRILEVGFGTGLNALLANQFANQFKCKIDYTVLEAYPLEKEVYYQLDYGFEKEVLLRLHEYDWNSLINISDNFSFRKLQTKLEEVKLADSTFDVVFFDAFAPGSQPELWTAEIFRNIKLWMATPSILTTYCAKGEVRRNMIEAGLQVEKLPGPPGKREMLRARLI